MGKTDVKTKEFWRDNGHFADLFNAVVFQGEAVIQPEQLHEQDTDSSASVKGSEKYSETVFHARDVVKKMAFGMEFVILGIEGQTLPDYSMPVRTMMYDALGYWRECRMISLRNRREKRAKTATELFSIRKEDRLHPIVTIVIYYGEAPWDGPKTLRDMLTPTEERLSDLIPEYPLNLVEIRTSDGLKFQNPDVQKLFSLVRKIYRKQMTDTEFQNVRKDLAEIIGIIVGSEKIVELAASYEKEEINMCRALEEMMQEKKLEGERLGLQRGKDEGKIEAYHDMGLSVEEIAEKLHHPLTMIREVLKRSQESQEEAEAGVEGPL